MSETGAAHAVGVVARDGDLQTNDERFVEELAQMQTVEADAVKNSKQLQAELDAACAAVRGQLPPRPYPTVTVCIATFVFLPRESRMSVGGVRQQLRVRAGATVSAWALAVEHWCGVVVQADGL